MIQYTLKEIEFLKENYPLKGSKFCTEKLNRSTYSIQTKARKLGIKRIHGHNNFNIEDYINPIKDEIIYFLGLFWADGNISYYKSNNINNYHVRLEMVKTDMDDIDSTLNKVGNWSKRQRKRKETWATTSIYNIFGKPFYDILAKYDYDKKSIVSPTKILNIIPQEKHYLFWRGFFDGDGCISYGKNYRGIKFSGCYEYEWDSLELILKQLNIKFSIYRAIDKHNKNSSIKIQNKKGIKTLIKYLYPNNDKTNIGLTRKRIKCFSYLNL